MPVDAHVGKALFHNAIMGALRSQGKTVIFVTHALHFLSHCDYICTLRDGSIAAHGTYQALVHGNEEFSRLNKQFGGSDSEQYEEFDSKKTSWNESKVSLSSTSLRASGTGTLKGKLITDEHRTTGSIPLLGKWPFPLNLFPYLGCDQNSIQDLA